MAIGGQFNNDSNGSNTKKKYENPYYSRLKFKENDGKLSLGITYKSGLMVLSISELKEGFQYENIQEIHLSQTKAKLLSEEIDKFLDYLSEGIIVEGKAFGVNAGMGEKVSYIGFHADFDKKVYITIGKFDGSGNIIESTTITLNKDYHFSLEWENINTMDVAKCYNDLIELYQLKNALEDFGRYMNGASAYSVLDLGRYDLGRILSKMDPIFDKLGIERLNSNNNGSRGNSFLDNSKSLSSNHVSIDDVID